MALLKRRYRPLDLLRYAGLFTWFCAAIPLPFMPMIYDEPMATGPYLAWWGLHILFGLIYWNLMRRLPHGPPRFARVLALLVMTAAALGISMLSESGLGGILLLIVAGMLPWVLPPRAAGAWLIGQNVLLGAAVAGIPEVTVGDAVLIAGLFLGISLFAFMSSVIAMRQNQARDELRKVNFELQATQALLAENTRVAERVRIARELHDLVGHHLTALTLNLEVATHLVQGKALEHVQQAHSLARLLLADVREVVSDMRRDDKVDLARALATLIEGVPEPEVHLDLPEELGRTDPEHAQVLLRCAQEVITNSVRHANARNLWIQLKATPQGLAMEARDDGRGVNAVEAGNGLRGMAERLRQLGGTLDIESAPGAGFSVRAWLPTEATT